MGSRSEVDAQPDGVVGGEPCAGLIEDMLGGGTVGVCLPGMGAVFAQGAVPVGNRVVGGGLEPVDGVSGDVVDVAGFGVAGFDDS